MTDTPTPSPEWQARTSHLLRTQPGDMVSDRTVICIRSILADLAAAEARNTFLETTRGCDMNEYVQMGMARDEAEARAVKAEGERDIFRGACERAGVCMSCVLYPPEPFGCTDCLNTGWENGGPFVRTETAEARADSLH